MSKSPLAVARQALAVGERSLPSFSHKFSPRRFSQAQLFAILALRQFFRTDYRGIITMLADHAELRAELKLTKLPHYSTLSYAAQRFEKKGLGSNFSMAL